MATRTVVDRNEEGKREEAEEAAALAELQSALVELVAGQMRELANAPQCGCGGGMRYVGRERSPTETALGTVGVAMGRYARARPAGRARVRGRRVWTSRRR